MSSTIFLSYASEQGAAAAQIDLSLRAEGHTVFLDRTSLPTGEAFDARIREAIEESDVFVFLVSPQSIAPGRYTLTELTFAEQVWPHPGGHVLPVIVEPVARDAIPAFLRAVTMLTPRGNVAAEVAAAVARMTAPWWRRMLAPRRLVPAAAVVVLAALSLSLWLPDYLARREQERRAMELVSQARASAASGDFANARTLLDQAHDIAPAADAVVDAQEQLAMESLRSAGLSRFGGDRSAFLTYVDEVRPVLTRGVSEATGERRADLEAHLGWADYLRQLGGVGGPEPADRYRGALEIDAANVYAHTMWAFELLRRRGSSANLAEAERHFAAALESGRDREYVRRVQISGLLHTFTNAWIDDPEREAAALRVVDDMRREGEPKPASWDAPDGLRRTIWAIYHFDVVASAGQPPVILQALPPDEHLATFLWLFPADDLPEDGGAPSPFDYFQVLAPLQEQAGDRDAALTSYRRVVAEFEKEGYDATAAVNAAADARAAIDRLSN